MRCKLADVVVVDVQCDYLQGGPGQLSGPGTADMTALEESLDVIAETDHPGGAGAHRDHRRPRHDGAGRLSRS